MRCNAMRCDALRCAALQRAAKAKVPHTHTTANGLRSSAVLSAVCCAPLLQPQELAQERDEVPACSTNGARHCPLRRRHGGVLLWCECIGKRGCASASQCSYNAACNGHDKTECAAVQHKMSVECNKEYNMLHERTT
jgi:hypothetical protein